MGKWHGLLVVVLLVLVSGRVVAGGERGTVPTTDCLVYVRNGDLYTRDFPSGQVRRLTLDGGNEKPHWSPNGKWIAYYHRGTHEFGQLCLIRRDGTGKHSLPSTSGFQPKYSFSPKSDEIAFVSNDNALQIMPLSGGKVRSIIQKTDGNLVVGVAWRPDGRTLAYATLHYETVWDDNIGKSDFNVSLWEVPVAGGKPQRLYTSKEHSAVPEIVGWSPDNRHLLFAALHYYPAGSVNADGVPLYTTGVGTKTRRLFTDEVLLNRGMVQFPRRGSRVAVSVGSDRFIVTHKRIALLDLATGIQKFVTPPSLAATCPVWSPDGTRIAYFACPNADMSKEMPVSSTLPLLRLWVMNADGTNPRRLESSQVEGHSGIHWLSDNRTLIFARVTEVPDRYTYSLWKMAIDGTGLTCIVPQIGHDEGDGDNVEFDVWH